MRYAKPRPIYYKRLDEKYPVGFKYKAPDIEKGETLSSAVVTVSPSGLSLDGSPVVTDDVVTQKISGGSSVGKKHVLKFKVTTSAGHVYVNTLLVEIIED